jgi:hypothetical protein
MAADGLSVVNAALAMMGENPIASLDPAAAFVSDREDTCKKLYPVARDAALQLHPWRFATKLGVQLAAPAAGPARWAKQFLMPADALPGSGPLAVYASVASGALSVHRWAFADGKIQADVDAAWIDHAFRAPEASWPPLFEAFFLYHLAAHLALSITETQSRGEAFREIAYGNPTTNFEGGLLGQAKRGLARYEPAQMIPVWNSPFVNARFGR